MESQNITNNFIQLLERTLQNFLLYVDGDYLTKIGGKFMVQTTADGEFAQLTEEGIKILGFADKQYLGQIFAVSLTEQSKSLFISAYIESQDKSSFIHVTIPIEWLLNNYFESVPHFAFINNDRLIINYAICLTEQFNAQKLRKVAEELANIKLDWSGIEKDHNGKN